MAGASHYQEEDEQERHLLVSGTESDEPEQSSTSEYGKQPSLTSGASCGRCLGDFLDPRTLVYRYVLIALLCLANICTVYSVDMPAALERTIINVMRIDTTQYELLYSLYFWPNVFLLVIGGILIDRVLGLRLGLIIFFITACLGQLVFAMGD